MLFPSRPRLFRLVSRIALTGGVALSFVVPVGCKSEERPSSEAKAAPDGAAVAAAAGASSGAARLPSEDSVPDAASAAKGEASPLGAAKVAEVPSATATASATAAKPPAKILTSSDASPSGTARSQKDTVPPTPSASAVASAAPAASFEAPPPAAPNSADAVAEKVDAIYLPIERFRARFEQKYTAKIAGTTKNSDGVCVIKRPGKVSFSYQNPNKNRVVSDGVTLKIYEAENQQMFTRSVASTEYPGALAFILGKGLRHSFNFTFNESAKWEGGPVLVGTPRVPNPGYEKVLFYIDEELLKKGDPSCVRRVLVIDAQGNRNRFDFIHVEQPATIPDSEFEFTPPEGTNVLN